MRSTDALSRFLQCRFLLLKNDRDFLLLWARPQKLAKEIKQVICAVVAFTLNEPQQPRQRVCPSRIVEGEATREPITEFASPQDFFRETLFYPSIDKIVAGIEARFYENEQELMLCIKDCGYGTLKS